MEKQTVTGSLRKIMNDLGLDVRRVYSDSRAKSRVGVKFVGIYPTDKQKEVIKTKMEELGFEYHSIKINEGSQGRPWGFWSTGTRFTFKKLV